VEHQPETQPNSLPPLDTLSTREGTELAIAGPWAYYTPAEQNNQLVVIARQDVIHEVIASGGASPPLRREMEMVLQATDAQRMFTALVAPSVFVTTSTRILSDDSARLTKYLDGFLSDQVQAAAISFHLETDLFMELRACGRLNTAPRQLAAVLHERIDQFPTEVKTYLANLGLHPFGRNVLTRFPQMVQVMSRHTRRDTEKNHALLRCCLPAVAAHNLLMGVELALSEPERARESRE
jgi:hypothetical protein